MFYSLFFLGYLSIATKRFDAQTGGKLEIHLFIGKILIMKLLTMILN